MEFSLPLVVVYIFGWLISFVIWDQLVFKELYDEIGERTTLAFMFLFLWWMQIILVPICILAFIPIGISELISKVLNK